MQQLKQKIQDRFSILADGEPQGAQEVPFSIYFDSKTGGQKRISVDIEEAF